MLDLMLKIEKEIRCRCNGPEDRKNFSNVAYLVIRFAHSVSGKIRVYFENRFTKNGHIVKEVDYSLDEKEEEIEATTFIEDIED
ncbi:MAG: hypothetical protein C4539_08940 [Ignavibacteriales bacterium]|nr:MAG: hypothetical protein C4539_08940 [Ignavibacteriales bacterium]